mmetsp:Transcript_26694/g.53614  ORF Transcript_26694/g.53614 Transcript_26694/m.53614 type:complete len:203 (-) Transcript_26694:385-993(-)
MPVVNQQLDAGRPYAQPYSHTPHATFAVYGRASGGSTDQPYFSCRESHEGAGGSSGWRLVGSSANLDWKTYGSTHPSLSAYFWRDFSGKAAMSTLGFIDLSRELATLFFSLRSVASFSIRTTEAAAMAISILPACSSTRKAPPRVRVTQACRTCATRRTHSEGRGMHSEGSRGSQELPPHWQHTHDVVVLLVVCLRDCHENL